jgi:hypothetical protein
MGVYERSEAERLSGFSSVFCRDFWSSKASLIRLTGEIILNDGNITLCSLDGADNVSQLRDVFGQYRPRGVILMLDSDEAGQRATRKGLEIAQENSIQGESDEHIVADVKELHKPLMLKGGKKT